MDVTWKMTLNEHKIIGDSLIEARDMAQRHLSGEHYQVVSKIKEASQLLTSVFQSNHKVISCGNGGSMCDAMHFAQELSGKFRKHRKSLPAIAISDPAYLSCVANDYGYRYVFSRFLQGVGEEEDCLFAISTSGESQNIIEAVKQASIFNMFTISLTGKTNSTVGKISDVDICVPGPSTDRIQEGHIKIIHIIIEMIERNLFPENYKENNMDYNEISQKLKELQKQTIKETAEVGGEQYGMIEYLSEINVKTKEKEKQMFPDMIGTPVFTLASELNIIHSLLNQTVIGLEEVRKLVADNTNTLSHSQYRIVALTKISRVREYIDNVIKSEKITGEFRDILNEIRGLLN